MRKIIYANVLQQNFVIKRLCHVSIRIKVDIPKMHMNTGADAEILSFISWIMYNQQI